MTPQVRDQALVRLHEALVGFRAGLAPADVEDGWSEVNRSSWTSWLQEIAATVERGQKPDANLYMALDYAGVGLRHAPRGPLLKHVSSVADALEGL